MAESPSILVNDAIRRQVLLEGVKVDQGQKFDPFVRKLERSIRARLTAEGLTIRNRTRLRALLSDIRAIESDVFADWIEELRVGLDGVAEVEGELEAKVLTSSIPDFEATLPATTQLISAFENNPLSVRGKSQGLTLKPFLKQYEADQIALIEGVISQGFAEGNTTAQIVQNLRGTRANNFRDGVLSAVDRNTKIMVRTAVQNSSTQAKARVLDANKDVIQGEEWISTLDSRTTSQCRSLDGEIFELNEGPRPPIHYGCRSTTSPVLDPSLDFLKQGSQRPARGEDKDGDLKVGQVNADTTYYSWLKNQPKQFQDKVLGPTRGKLLRGGGLTSEQFGALQLNSNFRPMTLEEMAKEAPEAFEAANLLNDDGNVQL